MKINMLTRLALGVAAVALTAPAVSQTAPQGAPRYGTFGVDLAAQDKSVRPGDDFWTYVNGSWNTSTEISPDRASAGVWVKLVDDAEQSVRAILDDMAKNPAQFGAKGKQIGDLYASWMDEAGVEQRGTAPLKPYLARIAAASDRAKLQSLFMQPGYASPVDVGVIPDLADPTQYTAFASQGTLGMPRDYYLNEGAKFDGYRTAYRAYVQQVLTLAGITDAAAKADRIVALETAMAKVHWSPEQNRNIMALYKPMDRAGMAKLAPEFDWAGMMQTAGLASMPKMIMGNDTALAALGKQFASVPVSDWQDWLSFHFISSNAAYLPRAFDDASFGFYQKTLSGTQEKRARWKRGVQLVNGALGEAVGEIYVARHYPPESSAKMNELIADLRASLDERLKANQWMDATTKEKALAKLAAFDPRVGHPDKYIDYSSMKVSRADLLGNLMASREWAHRYQLSLLGKPVDRTLWGMTPQTVNAYYNPQTNQITFPAAFLQAPFFDPKADPAVNYGAIGAVIGHEIGHGFDDQGSQFGPDGKFANWWTPEAKAEFTKRTAMLVEQYNQFEPVPGTKINGKLTLGENIGDLGGIEMAYGAYQRYQAKHGKAPVIGGLTGDQRFFLAYAQAWRSKVREDAERSRLLTDTHSPDKYRANGTVRNVDAWYTAFDIKPGDKLYLPPEQRVKIW
ncbi:M13 family metallopeptidase [Sphingomonas turrisvirgatae]|uniref:Endothelin-converting protein n=1 Tax=Sphingomonas turrisvirgatae TaxID=1888892 RepID=A0A1E3LY62_9SPHN|nr:M13 family metallopeptidase [Sphingomonas turrisvirgatae]ODP38678.1 endothelin-converting protein [Sphingomonas turrisvirgatae]